MIDMVRCAVRNLGRKKVRSALTIMGISIGVASVIMIGNISQCGTNAINTELDSLGLSGLSISTSTFGDTAISLTQDDLDLVCSNHSVAQAMPIMMENTQAYDKKSNELNTLLWGIDAKANQIISLKVIHGRCINNSDVNLAGNVCMVDQNFSKTMYQREDIVGKKIPILCGGAVEDYEVVGVIKTGSGLLQNMIGNYIPNFIYIPYTTMQDAIGRKSFDQIAVKVNPDVDVDAAGNEIVSTLARVNGFNEGYHANNLSKQKEGLSNLLNIVTVILSAVGAISLLVASLSIMTVMLVSVNERTREIGIKKSIGARRRTIMLEFLLEALLLSLIGCVIGAIVGNLVSYLGALYVGISLGVRLDIILLAMGFSVFTGVIFGVYPAAKASNLRPVDALRLE